MSLYLVAFAVGDIGRIHVDVLNGYKIGIWVRSEIPNQLHHFVYALRDIHAWYDIETGIINRGPKADHLIVPSKGGAMENWGLMTYGEQFSLYDRDLSSAFSKMRILSLQSHEVAHSWYGNLVTCKWWDDTWLNEGFAAYYSYRALEAHGWEWSEMLLINKQIIEADDERNSSNPVRNSIPTVWDAWNGFGGSTYAKGGAMLQMLDSILTTPTFKAGLKTYLVRFQYNTATTDDLLQILTEQAVTDGITNPDGSPLDLKLRMDPWLNQMGFPLVSVTRHANGTATLVRSHFLRPPNQMMIKQSPYNYTWDVPITVVSADSSDDAWDARPFDWIDINVDQTTVSGFPTDLNKWAIVNAKFSMYYRVMYDNASLAAIVSQLLQDNTKIRVESRSQIIDDAFSVARAGYFPETKAMETTCYLANETKWGPWDVALKHLKYSNRLIRGVSWAGLQRSYVLSLTVPVYERLGWYFNDRETPLQQFLRRDMIETSCAYGHAACLAEARRQYALIVQNPVENVVNPNSLPTVLCVGVRNGTESDWQMSFDQYLDRKSSAIRNNKYAYLYGCSCTTNITLLNRLLEALEDLILDRDRNTLVEYMAKSDQGSPIIWDYLDANWDNVSYGVSRMKHLKAIGLGFSTQNDLDKLLSFKSRHPPKSIADATSYTDLILDIEANIRWLNEHGPRLREWLHTHQPTTAGHSEIAKRASLSLSVPPSIEPWEPVHESFELNDF